MGRTMAIRFKGHALAACITLLLSVACGKTDTTNTTSFVISDLRVERIAALDTSPRVSTFSFRFANRSTDARMAALTSVKFKFKDATVDYDVRIMRIDAVRSCPGGASSPQPTSERPWPSMIVPPGGETNVFLRLEVPPIPDPQSSRTDPIYLTFGCAGGVAWEATGHVGGTYLSAALPANFSGPVELELNGYLEGGGFIDGEYENPTYWTSKASATLE